jgi:uncharacterized protein HemY
MNKAYQLDFALKAAAWEDAKGKLRALVALQGAYDSTAERGERYKQLGEAVNAFIEQVESNALQE